MKLYLLLSLLTVTIHTSGTTHNKHGKPITQKYLCAGVYVSPNEILTAGHCVEKTDPIVLVIDGETKYKAKVVKINHYRDLALLRVTNHTPHLYALLGNPASITDRVFTLNSGEDYIGTWGEGYVMNIQQPYSDSPAMILHSIPIKHGASGSGLFDAYGYLIGINDMTEGAVSWAINTIDIKAFLAQCHAS